MLSTKVTGPDWDKITRGLESDVAGFVTAAMRETVGNVKDAFRDQVRAGGLGDRLANAIRGQTFPRSKASLDPAGWVYANPGKEGGRGGAAAIIASYSTPTMIYPTGGRRLLAIPTEDTPRARQGQALGPREVESKFGRRLVFIPATGKFATPSAKRGDVVGFLVMKGLVVRKASSTWRNATQREREGRTRNPRPLSAVIMFNLVPLVRKSKRIDLSQPAAVAEERFGANLSAAWR